MSSTLTSVGRPRKGVTSEQVSSAINSLDDKQRKFIKFARWSDPVFVELCVLLHKRPETKTKKLIHRRIQEFLFLQEPLKADEPQEDDCDMSPHFTDSEEKFMSDSPSNSGKKIEADNFEESNFVKSINLDPLLAPQEVQEANEPQKDDCDISPYFTGSEEKCMSDSPSNSDKKIEADNFEESIFVKLINLDPLLAPQEPQEADESHKDDCELSPHFTGSNEKFISDSPSNSEKKIEADNFQESNSVDSVNLNLLSAPQEPQETYDCSEELKHYSPPVNFDYYDSWKFYTDRHVALKSREASEVTVAVEMKIRPNLFRYTNLCPKELYVSAASGELFDPAFYEVLSNDDNVRFHVMMDFPVREEKEDGMFDTVIEYIKESISLLFNSKCGKKVSHDDYLMACLRNNYKDYVQVKIMLPNVVMKDLESLKHFIALVEDYMAQTSEGIVDAYFLRMGRTLYVLDFGLCRYCSEADLILKARSFMQTITPIDDDSVEPFLISPPSVRCNAETQFFSSNFSTEAILRSTAPDEEIKAVFESKGAIYIVRNRLEYVFVWLLSRFDAELDVKEIKEIRSFIYERAVNIHFKNLQCQSQESEKHDAFVQINVDGLVGYFLCENETCRRRFLSNDGSYVVNVIDFMIPHAYQPNVEGLVKEQVLKEQDSILIQPAVSHKYTPLVCPEPEIVETRIKLYKSLEEYMAEVREQLRLNDEKEEKGKGCSTQEFQTRSPSEPRMESSFNHPDGRVDSEEQFDAYDQSPGLSICGSEVESVRQSSHSEEEMEVFGTESVETPQRKKRRTKRPTDDEVYSAKKKSKTVFQRRDFERNECGTLNMKQLNSGQPSSIKDDFRESEPSAADMEMTDESNCDDSDFLKNDWETSGVERDKIDDFISDAEDLINSTSKQEASQKTENVVDENLTRKSRQKSQEKSKKAKLANKTRCPFSSRSMYNKFRGHGKISERDWKEVWNFKTQRFYEGQYSDAVNSAFRQLKNLYCPLIMRRQRPLKRPQINGHGHNYNTIIYAVCRHPGCRHFRIELDSRSRSHRLCFYSCPCKNQKHAGKRATDLKGPARRRAYKIMKRCRAKQYYNKLVRKASRKFVINGNLLGIRSIDTLRKVKHEANGIGDLAADPVNDLLIMRRLQKLLGKDVYIMKVMDPLGCIIFSKKRYELFKEALRRAGRKLVVVLHLDSTGSVVHKAVATDKSIYYYALVYKIDNDVIPLTEMLSSEHGVPAISRWLADFRKYYHDEGGTEFTPKHIVTDCSLALLHGISIAFNEFSLDSYLNLCHRLLLPNDAETQKTKKKGFCHLHLCYSHFMKNVSVEVNKFYKSKVTTSEENSNKLTSTDFKNLKTIIMKSIILIYFCNKYEDIKIIFDALLTVLIYKHYSPAVEKALEQLNEKIQDKDQRLVDLSSVINDDSVEQIGDLDAEDVLAPKAEYLNAEDLVVSKVKYQNKFFFDINEIFLRILNASDSFALSVSNNKEVKQNIVYSRKFADFILRNWVRLLPMWSCLFVPVGQFDINHCESTSAKKSSAAEGPKPLNNAIAENWMGQIKTEVNNKEGPFRANRFVKRENKHVKTLHKKVLLNIPSRKNTKGGVVSPVVRVRKPRKPRKKSEKGSKSTAKGGMSCTKNAEVNKPSSTENKLENSEVEDDPAEVTDEPSSKVKELSGTEERRKGTKSGARRDVRSPKNAEIEKLLVPEEEAGISAAGNKPTQINDECRKENKQKLNQLSNAEGAQVSHLQTNVITNEKDVFNDEIIHISEESDLSDNGNAREGRPVESREEEQIEKIVLSETDSESENDSDDGGGRLFEKAQETWKDVARSSIPLCKSVKSIGTPTTSKLGAVTPRVLKDSPSVRLSASPSVKALNPFRRHIKNCLLPSKAVNDMHYHLSFYKHYSSLFSGRHDIYEMRHPVCTYTLVSDLSSTPGPLGWTSFKRLMPHKSKERHDLWLNNYIIDAAAEFFIKSQGLGDYIAYMPTYRVSNVLEKGWRRIQPLSSRTFPMKETTEWIIMVYKKGDHWILLLVSLKGCYFYYLDPYEHRSLSGVDFNQLPLFLNACNSNSEKKPKSKFSTQKWDDHDIKDRPYQKDAINCGVFCLFYIDIFVRKFSAYCKTKKSQKTVMRSLKNFPPVTSLQIGNGEEFDPWEYREVLQNFLVCKSEDMANHCLTCGELYSEKGGGEWVECECCHKWAHNRKECVKVENFAAFKKNINEENFVCLNCRAAEEEFDDIEGRNLESGRIQKLLAKYMFEVHGL